MTFFGARPDSRSPIARKIEAFVRAREEQQQASVVHVLHAYVPPVIQKPDWRPLKEQLCEVAAANRVRVLQQTRIDPPRASGAAVVAMVAKEHELPVDVIKGVARTHAVCLARHHAAYELAMRTQCSLSQIGRVLGGRAHTSIAYMIMQHARRCSLPIPRGMTFRKRLFRKRDDCKNS